MDYQSLYLKTVVELRKLARGMGVRIPSGAAKAVIINLLLEAFKGNAADTNEKKENAADKTTAGNVTEETVKNEPALAEAGAVMPQADECIAAENVGQDGTVTMRMAADPQVVDRRMPVRQEAPRDRSGSVQERPAGAALSTQRFEYGSRQGYTGGRADVPDARRYPDDCRSREPADRYGRTEMPDGRSRFVRQETGDGRIGPWREESRQDRYCDRRSRSVQESRGDHAETAAEADARRCENAPERFEGHYVEEYRASVRTAETPGAGECAEGSGVLEIQPDGYGFLRAENYRQGSRDVYVSIAQIRRFNLRMGDHVKGRTRPQREGDRYTAMMYITEVNGRSPEEMIGRGRFDELIPVYPGERLRLELPGENDLSLRMTDMIAPIGKGQRGLIVSPPKAGKTTLLKKLANAITAAHPEMHLIVLLIDERPEEVTDMKRSIRGEVVYSTFDETPESHTQVSEMVLERARRLVELGQDVVVLMDSITRLARAYNLVIPPTGRSLSGGLDPGALHRPKRFFGAARNIENGGSLTVIATALVDTGSRMDDIIYEEFKGTGNMELHLDRKLSDRRVFPAVDMVRSGTRREELLLTEAELAGAGMVRRMLAGGSDPTDAEKIIALMEKTGGNAEFFRRLSAYRSVYEKSGFSMSADTLNDHR